MYFEKMDYFASLLDFYGALLTHKQYETAKLFLFEDLSIVEIAEIFGTSKQAINDILKRTQSLLETYEKKLKIFDKFSKSNALISCNKELKEKFIKIWEN